VSFTESLLPEIVSENRSGLLGKGATWCRVKLSCVGLILNGFAFKSSLFNNVSGTPLVRIRDVLRGHSETFYSGEYEDAYLVRVGDLLIGMDGDFHCARWKGVDSLLNQRVCKVTALEHWYISSFLLYVLPGYLKAIHGATSAITVKHLSSRTLSNILLPLPPLVEQRAIVAKIEALFSELDKGVEQLEALQKQLKRYRQSVLKAAFEGKLTEAFRLRQGYGGQGRDEQSDLPTADDLLAQIKTERETRYKQALADWDKAVADWDAPGGKASGQKKPRKPAKPKELPPLTEEELAELPELPAGWGWCRLIEACDQVVDCHNKTPPYEDTGIFLVRTPNVRDGRIRLKEKIRFVSEATCAYWSRRCVPMPGDILFTREAPMGEACIIPPETRICMGQRMMLFRVFEKHLSNKYLLFSILDHQSISRALRNSIGSGVQHLRVGQVEQLIFPLAPPPEQHQIVDEIESRFSVLDQLEKTVEDGLKQAEALRQSILKKAFEGRLLNEPELAAVRADPEYEPAEKLLERIRVQRANEQKEAKKAKGKRLRNTTKRVKA
jgi:type I restriction enzyme, S subunit